VEKNGYPYFFKGSIYKKNIYQILNMTW